MHKLECVTRNRRAKLDDAISATERGCNVEKHIVKPTQAAQAKIEQITIDDKFRQHLLRADYVARIGPKRRQRARD